MRARFLVNHSHTTPKRLPSAGFAVVFSFSLILKSGVPTTMFEFLKGAVRAQTPPSRPEELCFDGVDTVRTVVTEATRDRERWIDTQASVPCEDDAPRILIVIPLDGALGLAEVALLFLDCGEVALVIAILILVLVLVV
jgi:hypothetical protein